MPTNLTPDQSKKEFQRILHEFGRVMLLGIVLGLGVWYLWAQSQPQKLYVHCDAERIRTRLGKATFVNGEQAFTGGVLQSNEQAHSGQYSARMSATARFALETRIPNLTGEEEILLRIWRYADTPQARAASLVVEIAGTEGGIVRKATQTQGNWQQLELHILKDCRHEGQNLKVYCWNPSGEVVYFDDLEIWLR